MWDLWVISAADKKQKQIFEKELDILRNQNRISDAHKFIVIADPENKKSGSGGATLHIYNELKLTYGRELLNRKVIVIHSGGYSKRFPAYSIQGKLFSNVIHDEKPMKLLEFYTKEYSRLSESVQPGIFIVPGDMNIPIKQCPDMRQDTIYGFSAKADIETSSRHGVYITDEKNNLKLFLHKVSKDELCVYADENNELDIDTGIVFLPYIIIEKINETLGSIREPINLYNDILMPLSQNITKEKYINSGRDDGNTDKIEQYRNKLFELLNPYSMKVVKQTDTRFGHIGTTEQYIKNLVKDSTFIDNSIIGSLPDAGTAVIENSMLTGKVHLGKGCMISGVITDKNFTLPSGYVLAQIPVIIDNTAGYATLKYPADCNPKSTAGYLWNLKIFWFSTNRNQSLQYALENYEDTVCSFEDCLKKCDTDTLLQDNSDIMFRLDALKKLGNDKSKTLNKPLMKKTIMEISGVKMPHIFRYLSDKLNDDFYKKSFARIRQHICSEAEPEISEHTPVVHPSVQILSAARINFAGGYTDTPPYCYENGGSVTNIAILPDSKYPIKVTISSREDKKIVFKSSETESETIISSIGELTDNRFDEKYLIEKHVCMATGIISDSHIRGMDIAINSDLPNGSGLGTSSIIINACLMGIFHIFNIDYDKDYLINKTLQIEQMMGCGGGWQDQAGVLWPGIKLIETEPGLPQGYTCSKYDFSKNFIDTLNSRMVLIYTGKRRKARNILKKTVSAYLLKQNNIVKKMDNKKILVALMDKALRAESIELLSKCLIMSYELDVAIESSFANEHIKTIIDNIGELMQGYSVCGAGGGGFLLAILKPQYSIADINKKLSNNEILDGTYTMRCIISDIPVKII